MNYRIMFFIASVLLMLPLSVMADNSLESAEKAYNEGKFAEASAIYGKISQEHGVSASLLANMGNAYAKAGDYGQAFLCYERSLYLDPSSNEVRNNRAYILSKIEDGNKANAKGKNISVVADEPSFFSRVKRYVTYSHTSDTWAVWGAVSFVLLCGCIALYIFRTEVLLRKIGFFGGLSLLVLCVVFMTFSFAWQKHVSLMTVVLSPASRWYCLPSLFHLQKLLEPRLNGAPHLIFLSQKTVRMAPSNGIRSV